MAANPQQANETAQFYDEVIAKTRMNSLKPTKSCFRNLRVNFQILSRQSHHQANTFIGVSGSDFTKNTMNFVPSRLLS